MKKLLLILLLASTTAFAQVDSNQLKKKTSGGIVGDSSRAIAVGIYRGTDAPGTPVTGQFWCDTNTTPCTLKTYNGSTWEITPPIASINYQADLSSFPGTPTDGQLFYAKIPGALYVYDGTNAKWMKIGANASQSQANIRDVYSTAVITPPSSAPTATKSTSCATGMTTGNISYKVTFQTSTGGETTGSPVSGTINLTASTDCGSLTDIPTGGSGTTSRMIYKTVAGQPAGDWYFIGRIADNTTTTYTDTTIQTFLTRIIPQTNYSAPLPSGWTYTASTTNPNTGGCGGTAAATVACTSDQNGLLETQACTTDDRWFLTKDISSYTTGDFTIQYRIVDSGYALPTYTSYGTTNGFQQSFSQLRTSTATNSQFDGRTNGYRSNPGGQAWPLTSGNPLNFSNRYRSSTGAAIGGSNYDQMNNPWPPITAYPWWVRIVKRGDFYSWFYSGDGVNWTKDRLCNGTSNSNASCASSTWSSWTHSLFAFVVDGGCTSCSCNYKQGPRSEFYWDSWTLSVD